MSLHALANHMSSRGRGEDSMLVHMTPGEVHGLQALAMKHGGSLTINPDTGLPEAGFLSSILPMLAGFALNAFVPGLGTAIGGALGTSAAVGTGIAVGGITGLATGSLSKGLMAGLGAYGGAGLSEGLLGAGAASGAGQTLATEAAKQATLEGITLPADYASLAAKTAMPDQIAAARAAATPGDLLSAGAKSAAADPMAFAKQNWKPIAAASLPVLGEIATTTPGPTASPMAPGRIREKRWDGRQFVDVASTDANVYNTSGRSFSDLYRGYNGGGIVALADGGMPGYAPGGEIFDWFAKNQGKSDADIAAQMQAQKWTPEMVANATGTQNQLADYQNRFVKAINTPTTDASEFMASTSAVGLQNQPLADLLANQNLGLSQAAQYATTHALDDRAGMATDLPANNVYSLTGYTPGALPGDKGGLEGLYANINQVAQGLQGQIASGKLTGQDARAAAISEMNRIGMSAADLKAATGKTLVELFPDTLVKPPVVTPPVTNTKSGYHLDDSGVLVPNISATQNTTTDVATPTDLYTAPETSLPVGVSGNTGPSQIGGGATVNPNGTITTSPRIPGIPVGGFTGAKNLRDAYTKGGGSLGYTSAVPASLEDFNKKYVTDRMSGDSLAAYEYLTGKKGAAYPVKSGVGQISRPYDEAVLGYPARGNLPYVYNKATGKMDPNPDYVAPGRDAAGNVTYSMSLNDIKSSLKDAPLSGQALYDWAISNNLSAQQIADATGRTLSSVYADFRAGSKSKTAADKKKADDAAAAANNQMDSSSTGGEAAGGLQQAYAMGGATGYALGGLGTLGGYSDGGRLLKGPGDGVSDSIPATIGAKGQPARLADGEFVVPARIVSELGNGSTDAGAKKLYAMMDRVQRARGKTTGKNKVAANSRADQHLPA